MARSERRASSLGKERPASAQRRGFGGGGGGGEEEVEVEGAFEGVAGRYASVRCLAMYFPVKPVDPQTTRSSVFAVAAIVAKEEWKSVLRGRR